MSESYQSVEIRVNVQIGTRFEGSDLVISFLYNPPVYNNSEIKIPLINFRGEK